MIVSDESGVLNVVWYNNRYVKNQFKTGDKYVLYGKVTKNRGKLEMVNPVCEQEGKERFTGKIVPLYPLTSGLTQKILQSTMGFLNTKTSDFFIVACFRISHPISIQT